MTARVSEYVFFKINAQQTLRRPLTESKIGPVLPKSTCNSAPGSPSATRTVTPGLAYAQHLQGITVQGPLTNLDPLTSEQFVGLDHRQVLINKPHLQLVVMGLQSLPAGPMAVQAVRAHPLTHLADQDVRQLGFVAVADQPDLHPRRHITLDRLAVHQRQTGDRPVTLVGSRRTSRISCT